jgi:hypothetical protein
MNQPLSLRLEKETLKVLGASTSPVNGLWTTTTVTVGLTRPPMCGPTR